MKIATDPDWYGSEADTTMSPEHKLMVGILYRALKDCFKGEAHHMREAKVWFRSKSEGKYPWTFDEICDELAISTPSRRKILQFVSDRKNARVFFRLAEFS